MIKLTDEIWKQITDINRQVNFAIEYLGDQENYGVPEYWSIPINGRDDCDGFSLMKQDELRKKGIESFMAVCGVYNPLGDHAVVLVDTDRGTFSLDNRFPGVQNYSDSNYNWVKRETNDPNGKWGTNKWVKITS